MVLRIQLFDTVVHTWDLATSLGLQHHPTPEVLELVPAIAHGIPHGPGRPLPGAAFEPSVTVISSDPGPRLSRTWAGARAPDRSRPFRCAGVRRRPTYGPALRRTRLSNPTVTLLRTQAVLAAETVVPIWLVRPPGAPDFFRPRAAPSLGVELAELVGGRDVPEAGPYFSGSLRAARPCPGR
jgi:hypothetical protein